MFEWLVEPIECGYNIFGLLKKNPKIICTKINQFLYFLNDYLTVLDLKFKI